MLVKNKKGFYQVKELLLPGLIHGISTKRFGNLSYRYGPKKVVAANEAKFVAALEIKSDQLVKMGLIHGTSIAIVTKKDRGQTIPATDALITNQSGVVLWLLTGDCAPYLLFDPKKKVIAAAHSGWMGTVGKIVSKTVLLMITRFGCQLDDILIGVGPAIEKCCYVNQRPVVEEFLPEWQDFISLESGTVARVDLNGFTINELKELGLPLKNIFYSNFCTQDHSDEFFCSQEETAGITKPGRFASAIQMV